MTARFASGRSDLGRPRSAQVKPHERLDFESRLGSFYGAAPISRIHALEGKSWKNSEAHPLRYAEALLVSLDTCRRLSRLFVAFIEELDHLSSG